VQPAEPFHYSNRHDDPGAGWATVVLDAQRILFTKVQGKGSVKGTRAVIAMWDEAEELRQGGEQVDGFLDLEGLTKTPLRAQAILAKWLILHLSQIGRVAIFGARPWERKIARAVMKIARFNRADFFVTREEAGRWLRPGAD